MKNKLKTVVGILLFFLISGCSTSEPKTKLEENEFENIDTILRRSEKNFSSVTRVTEKSDSSIQKKVEKTVKQINTLKNEVKLLKEENNVLKSKIDDVDDVGKPFQLLPVSNGKNDR